MLYSILVTTQVVVALSLVGLILLQHGKGADAGAAFGSGASGTVFGAKGSANFMSRATAGLAIAFFALSLTLAYLVNAGSTGGSSVTSSLPAQTANPAETKKDGSNSGDKNSNSGSSNESQKNDEAAAGSEGGESGGDSGKMTAPPAPADDKSDVDAPSDTQAGQSGGDDNGQGH
ncbi:preprotein translocase subunit SecG [Salinisphaera sp. USBA-960]|nr:preprotein translocase subunit SecG [Salifodinibacter halophilus]NNC25536.1 preprotein translocase subunit SecG [Salifodinibacter halophilus]